MLEWIESRTRHYIPKYNDVLLCSSIDPQSEAKKWLLKQTGDLTSYEVFFILGLGGGFHITCLAQKFPNAEIIVLEPSKELEKQLLSRRGPMPENVTILSGLSSTEVKQNVFVRAGIKSLYRTLTYPTSYRMNREYFGAVEELLYGRTQEALLYHLEGRNHLRHFFESLNIFEEGNTDVTILDIERALRARKTPLEREAMIFMALRELVR